MIAFVKETKFPVAAASGMSGNPVAQLLLKGHEMILMPTPGEPKETPMNREPSATDPSQGWWTAFLRWVKSLDYSSYDHLADRMTTLEEELAQLKRTRRAYLPPTPASDRQNR